MVGSDGVPTSPRAFASAVISCERLCKLKHVDRIFILETSGAEAARFDRNVKNQSGSKTCSPDGSSTEAFAQQLASFLSLRGNRRFHNVFERFKYPNAFERGQICASWPLRWRSHRRPWRPRPSLGTIRFTRA